MARLVRRIVVKAEPWELCASCGRALEKSHPKSLGANECCGCRGRCFDCCEDREQ